MIALLVALLLQSAYPTPPPSPLMFAAVQDPAPSHGATEGPYAHVPGAICWRLDTIEARQQYHCDCKLMCDAFGNGREDNTCKTYCGSEQCICHADEGCQGPDVQGAPK